MRNRCPSVLPRHAPPRTEPAAIGESLGGTLQVEGASAVYGKNADGSVCVRPFPDGIRINVVDNAANLP
jgi:hypothetical protein